MVRASLLCTVCSVVIGSAATLVAPNAQGNSAGNAATSFPTTPTSIEIQEVVGSGQLPLNPIQITGISFRAAPGAGATKITIGSLNVYLSTSPNFPNTNGTNTLMSTTFANNVGPDKTLVFSGSNISWSDAGCAKPGPCPFDINIVFTTPFQFNATGPLLIDMQATNFSATSGAFDDESFPGAPGGSVAQVIGPLGAATGNFAYQGNVVQLTYTVLTTNNPSFTGIVNVASNIPPGMPNYGIAQGSLFAIYGSNLGPPTLSVANLPLPTTAGLSGTSVTIGVNGTTVTAPIYFTRTDVVVAVMPSNAPVGNGTLILTYNGVRGSNPITVAQSAFGISNNLNLFTDNGIGNTENGAVTFASNFQTITATNTAKPGDTLVIWGTGLGATPNGGSDTGPPPAGNIGNAPLVFVGGVQSPNVSYWGRSPATIPGLDQINFVVPPNAPLGCNVSVVVQTTNGTTPIVSNGPNIALAATDGATCSDTTQIVPSSALNASSIKVAYIAVDQSVSQNPGGMGTSTDSKAQTIFFTSNHSQTQALAQSVNAEPSFGSCYTGISANPSANGNLNLTPLNAGTAITLSPPSGNAITLPMQGGGNYKSADGTTAYPSGIWTLSNGSGGPDVGALNFKFPMPQQVTWTNMSAVTGSQVDRTMPLTITWSGGDSNGYVDIQGQASVPNTLTFATYYVGFECAAPASAGQFTIPPSILLAMPTGPTAFASLQVSTYALPYSVGNVSGFDAAVNGSQFQTSVPVVFK